MMILTGWCQGWLQCSQSPRHPVLPTQGSRECLGSWLPGICDSQSHNHSWSLPIPQSRPSPVECEDGWEQIWTKGIHNMAHYVPSPHPRQYGQLSQGSVGGRPALPCHQHLRHWWEWSQGVAWTQVHAATRQQTRWSYSQRRCPGWSDRSPSGPPGWGGEGSAFQSCQFQGWPWKVALFFLVGPQVHHQVGLHTHTNFGQNHVYFAPISSMQWQTMQQWWGMDVRNTGGDKYETTAREIHLVLFSASGRVTFRKVTPTATTVNEKKFWQVPQLNWHVSSPIWAFFALSDPSCQWKIDSPKFFHAQRGRRISLFSWGTK